MSQEGAPLRIDTAFAEELRQQIADIEESARAKLPHNLPYDQYQQSCGYLEAMRQVREVLIPQILDQLQRS